MALGLNDLINKNKTPPQKSKIPKTKTLRPWQSYDQYETQVRTLAAKEAVLKAEQRDQGNNKTNSVNYIPEQLSSAELPGPKHLPPPSSSIRPGFFSFLKYLIFFR